MFINAKQLDDDQLIEGDICIIGAGAAGITLARELKNSDKRIIVLESGGFEYDKRTQSLYKGENIGLPSFDLHVNRLRYFGGTTNHWAGHCRPLDPIDFERRQWLPHSGWPITRTELDPYYQLAQPIVGLGEYRYEQLDYFADKTALPILPLADQRLKSAVYNQSPPTRFGPEYKEELAQADNIDVYLNANVLRLNSNETASHVASADVACIKGPSFKVKAKVFVLATGGMENVRVLLLSNQHNPQGLGNSNGLVGRFFMDHILLRPGVDISLTWPNLNLNLYRKLHNVAGGRMFAILAASEQLLRREKMGNFRLHLVTDGPRYSQPIGGVFSDLDGFADANPLATTANNSIALHMVLEPMPNPDSRVSLSKKRDLFGQPRLAVNWQVTGKDLSNAHRALMLAALEFGRMGLGRGFGEIFERPDEWPGHLEAGKHHCGTTRMSDSETTGVVNRDCRMFEVDNLYIAGSSLFPTIGYANPTLTIVALALRLADHLKRLSI